MTKVIVDIVVLHIFTAWKPFTANMRGGSMTAAWHARLEWKRKTNYVMLLLAQGGDVLKS